MRTDPTRRIEGLSSQRVEPIGFLVEDVPLLGTVGGQQSVNLVRVGVSQEVTRPPHEPSRGIFNGPMTSHATGATVTTRLPIQMNRALTGMARPVDTKRCC